MIQNFIFGFYLLISDSLAESIKAKKKTSKIDYPFYNTVSLKKHHSFYEPQLNIVKNILP